MKLFTDSPCAGIGRMAYFAILLIENYALCVIPSTDRPPKVSMDDVTWMFCEFENKKIIIIKFVQPEDRLHYEIRLKGCIHLLYYRRSFHWQQIKRRSRLCECMSPSSRCRHAIHSIKYYIFTA